MNVFNRRRAFTLVELLVVISIIGVLIGLLMPAVQNARESARRTQCANSVRQLALGFQHHLADHGFYPTGGWGWWWMGDADRPCNREQPGPWCYTVLPYIELAALHELPHDNHPNDITAVKKAANKKLATTIVPAFVCPTARPAQLWPCVVYHNFGAQVYNCDDVDVSNRADYAVNGGTVRMWSNPGTMWGSGPSPADGYAGKGFIDMTPNDGIACQRSETRVEDVTDGTASTYMLGEKYRNPIDYATGLDYGDDHTVFAADDFDRYCWADQPPLQNRSGVADFFRWGSAHADMFNVAMCDGSMHAINYNIDPTVHRQLGSRNDGTTVDLSKF